MIRFYKNWEIKFLGKDKRGSHWLVVSYPNFLNKGETGCPELRHREILKSIKECKNYIDKLEGGKNG